MKTSPDTDQLMVALVAAQSQYKTIPKLRSATITPKSGGASYTYNYADKGDITEVMRPILNVEGLVVVQTIGFKKGKDVLTTRLSHISGQWMQDTMRLLFAQDDPRVEGSAVTYAKRYAYTAILDIDTDTDDDGQLASAAYGDAGTRTRGKRGPRSSTPTNAAARVTAQDPLTAGRAGTTVHQRNKITKALHAKYPELRGADAELVKVKELLKTVEADADNRSERLNSMGRLTNGEAEGLFKILDIDEPAGSEA